MDSDDYYDDRSDDRSDFYNEEYERYDKEVEEFRN